MAVPRAPVQPGGNLEEFARHRSLGDLRLDVVGHAFELPPERIGNHRDRLRQPDVPDGAVLHPRHECLDGEAGADFLLERKAPDASVLHAIGLPELVTASLTEYEGLAAALALDRDRLAMIKAKLMRKRVTEPLFDTKRFTRHIDRSERLRDGADLI